MGGGGMCINRRNKNVKRVEIAEHGALEIVP